ncbi:MAG: tetratricopeptide repeat protein [Acidobacteriota bacterium]
MSRPRSATRAFRGPRLWLFRILAVGLVPLAFLCLEAALRLLGVGASTDFLIPGEDGQLRSNPRFSERFFPRTLARPPVPFTLESPKPADVVRLFVVGGSAARGTPEPAFGVSRVLEALLELSYPDRRFEVVNAAITAINSHVALPIVEDVVDRGEADLILVYLGNNEVVGPFGAASVLGDFSPSRGAIRLGLTLRQSRGVQLLDHWLKPEPPRDGWRGMEMFLGQTVAAEDPRLGAVYSHFADNLEAMARAAARRETPLIFSTVAVNLRHQAPFASLPAADAGFAETLERGRQELARGDAAGAVEVAESLLPQYAARADVHFLHGSALAALGQVDGARAHLERARDLDALRFRADTGINDRLRAAAEATEVPLVDAAEAFSESLAGRRFFLEHVHLRFEGNLALARLFAAATAETLGLGAPSTAAVTAPAVARHLALTPEDALAIEEDMLELVRRPPFAESLDALTARHAHIERLRRLASTPQARQQVEAIYAARLGRQPDDLTSRRRRAEIFERWGETARALEDRRRLAEDRPDLLPLRRAYAIALSKAGQNEAAVQQIEDAMEDRGLGARIRAELAVDLGGLHEAAGRLGDAAHHYRRAQELDPASPLPPFNLAMLAAQRGQLNRAVEGFEGVTREHPSFAPAWQNLGVAFEKKGNVEAAERSFRAEMDARPDAAGGAHRLGRLLLARGHVEGAAEAFTEAIRRQIDHAPSYFRLADLQLAAGRAAEAAELYRIGLRFRPRDARARQGLARAEAGADGG